MLTNEPLMNPRSRKFRVLVYFLSFIIQVILVIFFQDGTVFYDTALDIFINHSVLYANTTLQSTFNYFPLVYLVTLPQICLYYQLPFRNDILLRLFFRLPIILADLLLASLFSDKIQQKFNLTNLSNLELLSTSSKRSINNFELFILFNPINIYIVGMTNQIDVFPAIFLVISWIAFKNKKFYASGIFVMTAFLIKEYAIFLMIFLMITYLKTSFNALRKFLIGNLIIFIPTIGIISAINFNGFMDHAIIYQLFRQPIGSSLSAFVYELGLIIVPTSFKTDLEIIISICAFGIIFLVMMVSGIVIYKNPSDKNIIWYTVLSFLVFCIFNKVFWPQYLVPLLALLLLYRIESAKNLSNEIIYWTISILPIFLLYRSGELATHTLVFLLGLDFFTDLLIIGILLHLILFLSLFKFKKITFRNK